VKLTRNYTEAEFTEHVLALAKLHGWRRAHFRPARTAKGWRTAVQGDGKGFPDLVLLRGVAQIAAELKMPGNSCTQDQLDWLDAFKATGARTFIWYPNDWPEIERVLGGRS
jgi:hypothetical protein